MGGRARGNLVRAVRFSRLPRVTASTSLSRSLAREGEKWLTSLKG